MIYKFFMLVLFFVINSQAVALTAVDLHGLRDPFQVAHINTQRVNFPDLSVSQISLIGSMVFGEHYYAFIGTTPQHMAWVAVGDAVGSEKAVVIEITTERVMLKEQEKSYTKLWEIKKPQDAVYA